MHYSSGDVFHGEWADNVRSGEGKMVRLLLRRGTRKQLGGQRHEQHGGAPRERGELFGPEG